jgi:hypothetical protein
MLDGCRRGVSRSQPLTGNGSHPRSMPAELGCWSAAPFAPHLPQRTDHRNRSLEASSVRNTRKGCVAPDVSKLGLDLGKS